MNESQFAQLLTAYVNGTCTEEEIAVINKWYSKYQHDPDFINSLPAEEREFLKDRLFNKILEGTHPASPEPEKSVPPTTYILQSWWAKVAVAAVLLCLIKFALLDRYLLPSQTSHELSTDISVVNQSKNILKHVLPDQSIVWLNPGAKLSFPRIFDGAYRKVRMSGDCFFEVTKDPQRPFIIHTAHLVTKVWGTSFRITDQKEASVASVTVVTGKVSVSKSGSAQAAKETKLADGEVILLPKEEIVYQKKDDKFYTNRDANMSDMNRWKRINLSFENTKLPEIVKVLDARFMVHIQLHDDSMSKIAMTADLTDLNLPEVLEVLKASLNISYEVTDDHISLKN